MNNTVDPLRSLLDYVMDVKPYHTKIYEIVLEYVFTEPANVTVAEQLQISILIIDGQNPGMDGGASSPSNWTVCPGVGWDTGPADVGLYDYPLVCNTSRNRISASITETLTITVTDGAGDGDAPLWPENPPTNETVGNEWWRASPVNYTEAPTAYDEEGVFTDDLQYQWLRWLYYNNVEYRQAWDAAHPVAG